MFSINGALRQCSLQMADYIDVCYIYNYDCIEMLQSWSSCRDCTLNLLFVHPVDMCPYSPQQPNDLFRLFSLLVSMPDLIRVAIFGWPFIFTCPAGSRITIPGWQSIKGCGTYSVDATWLRIRKEPLWLSLRKGTFSKNWSQIFESVATSLQSSLASSYTLLNFARRFHKSICVGTHGVPLVCDVPVFVWPTWYLTTNYMSSWGVNAHPTI